MSPANHEINLSLRNAAAFERAALAAEADGQKNYEMKMASAGASAYDAFVKAAKAAPEHEGRKIDEKAILRLYKSTSPRAWWDKHLASVKLASGSVANREWAARTIQWHIDPAAAKARRANQALKDAKRRERLVKQAPAKTHGARAPQAPTRAEADALKKVGENYAIGGKHRELPREEDALEIPMQDLLGEVNRISSAVRKIAAADRIKALEILRVTARELERYG